MTFPKRRAAALCAAALLGAVLLQAQANPPHNPTAAQPKPHSSASASNSKARKSASAAPAAPKNNPNAIDRHASRGQYLAHTALGYRGAPYRWGGRSPKSGFDCSGLVQAVYAKWGIALPRSAGEQYHVGRAVAKNALQPGDLVFFKNTYKRGISHVGIYIGNGAFIHAATSRKGVMMSRLDTGYHAQHWAGARRLDLSKLPQSSEEKQAAAIAESAKVYLDSGDGKNADTAPDSPAVKR